MTDWWSSEMDWKWNLSNVWDKLTWPFRRVYEWLKKSIQYSIFLWKYDYDFDYSSLLRLMQYKIGRMRKHMFEHAIIENSDFYARQMLVAELMLQQIMDEEFLPELEAAHNEKWGELKMDFIEDDDPNVSTSMCDIYRTKARKMGKDAEKQERQESMDLHCKQEEAKQRMYDDLFKWIRDHIECWWD